MENDYNPDIVTVTDEQGNLHTFEELDRIETDTGRYVALLPVYDNPEDFLDDDGEIIILKVIEDQNCEPLLVQIDNQSEFDEIYEIFDERLKDLFDED